MPRADLNNNEYTPVPYRERVGLLRDYFENIFADTQGIDSEFRRICNAVIRDGWPEPMARQGMLFGRETWQIDVIAEAFEAEMASFGGISALEGRADAHRVTPPKSIVHIWPALPGAGLTPVLYGALLGVAQWIRPSRRGRHFAEYVARTWPNIALPLRLLDPEDAWDFGDITVVSGSDKTVSYVRNIVENSASERCRTVTGYGHRVSFCVLVDGPKMDLNRLAKNIATDTVMWHQMGCFSPRAVLFVGTRKRLSKFGALLGGSISHEETRLGADDLNTAQLAERAQARGVAEFKTQIWGTGIGWVQLSDEPFRGERISSHTLSLHPIESIEQLPAMINLLPRYIQGVSLAAPADKFESWAVALSNAGATRICAPGALQMPPGDWPHDGRPNTLNWLRASHIRGRSGGVAGLE